MISLFALWLPILVSAVIVFVASSIIHMMPTWHRGDFPRMPNEAEALDALRPLAIPPGEYMVPRASSMKEFKTPEFVEKMSRGPVMLLTVMPNGHMSMGRNLSLWFVYLVVVGVFVAYVTSRSLAVGADYARVFQIAGAT